MTIGKSSKSHKRPQLRKFLFIRKHIDLCKLCFLNKDESHKGTYGRAILDLARVELAYSKKTASCDIFWSIKGTFDQFKEHFINGKPIAEILG